MSNYLCSSCASKTPSVFLGTCNVSGCRNVVTSFDFKLCDQCAQKLNECKWCRTPLSGGATPLTTAQAFTVLRDGDNGTTLKSMRVNEQVHIHLEEDRYSGKTWGVKTSGYGVNNSGSKQVIDPSDPQYQTHIFIFDCLRTGTWDIELHELVGQWSWSHWGGGQWTYQPAQGGKVWKCTVTVK